MSIHSFLTNLEDEVSVKGGRICDAQFVNREKKWISSFGFPSHYYNMGLTIIKRTRFRLRGLGFL
jgi:hypothetical protein